MHSENQTPDLIYLIDNRQLALQYPPSYFYYLKGPKLYAKWQVGNTQQDLKIGLHTALTFDRDPSGLEDSDLKALPRFGAFFVDFDLELDPARAIGDSQCFVRDMLDLGVPHSGIHPYVSGKKGGGVYLDSRLFGPLCSAGHPNLCRIWKLVAEHYAKKYNSFDTSIYSEGKGRMQRAFGRKRENGRFRAHIPTHQFLELSAQEIIECSAGPGTPVTYAPDMPTIPEFERLYFQLAPQAKAEVQAEESGSKGHRRHKAAATVGGEKDLLERQGASEGASGLEVYPCVQKLVTAKESDLTGHSNFHRMSFLTAIQTSNLDPEIAQRIAAPLCQSWRSSSMNTIALREHHFRRQQRQVQKKGFSLACRAVRATLKNIPCLGCPRFDLRASVLGQEISGNSAGISIRRLNSKGDVIENPISNAVPILKERVVIKKCGDGESESILRFSLYAGRDCFDLELRSSELSKFDQVLERINQASRGAVYLNRKTWDLFLMFGIQIGTKCESIRYRDLGWYSKQLFVFPNCLVFDSKITFPEQSPTIGYDSGFTRRLKWTSIEREALPPILERWFPLFLKFSSPEVAVSVLAHVITPILSGFAGITHRYFLLIIGATGGGKTTVVRVSMSLFGDHFDLASFISASSTPNRIEVEGAHFRHLPFPVDDVKAANISNPVQFRRILQNFTDGSARSRLNSKAQVIANSPIEGAVLMTGEDSPAGGESSILGRGLEIHAENLPKDDVALGSLQDLASDTAGIMPHFIAFLQAQAEPKDLLARFRNLKRRFSDRIEGEENRERILSSVALNFLSLQVFIEWAITVAATLKDPLEKALEQHFEFLVDLGGKQIQSAEELTPAILFLRSLRSILSYGKARIASYQDSYGEPGVGLNNAPIIGYSDGAEPDVVFIEKVAALGLVRELLTKSGVSLDFSAKAIGASLKRGDFLYKSNEGRTGVRFRAPTSLLIDTWALKKEALYDRDYYRRYRAAIQREQQAKLSGNGTFNLGDGHEGF